MKDPASSPKRKLTSSSRRSPGEIQTILERAYAMPADVIKEAKDAMSLTGGANE
jgi:hypothetical protein